MLSCNYTVGKKHLYSNRQLHHVNEGKKKKQRILMIIKDADTITTKSQCIAGHVDVPIEP